MPQVQLPIFPAGSVEINRDLACRCEEAQVIYYNGHLPVFMHAKEDLASFRLFTSQLIVQGSATQGDIAKAFGVPLVSIKRGTKLYRACGTAGFFRPKARREGSKLTAEKLEQARLLLLQGHPLPVVSQQTGVLTDTLRKAIAAGRLPPVKKRLGQISRPVAACRRSSRRGARPGRSGRGERSGGQGAVGMGARRRSAMLHFFKRTFPGR
jgi:transposase